MEQKKKLYGKKKIPYQKNKKNKNFHLYGMKI